MPFEVLPSQTGKTALVTGANSGIGFETALELAAAGAHVILACRSSDRAEKAVDRILMLDSTASLEVLLVDLSDLDSVRAAANEFARRHVRLDILVNNAGIMAVPASISAQGFDFEIASNHLGHFAFSGLVLPALMAARGSRVVAVSSLMHRMGVYNPSLLGAGRARRSRWRTYGDTKLANLLFAFELDRRLAARVPDASRPLAVAAHPGWAHTNLTSTSAGLYGGHALKARSFGSGMGQSPQSGARPLLYAATSPDVVPGAYYGPRRMFGLFGAPTVAWSTRRSRRVDDARDLFDRSCELTGVDYAAVALAPNGLPRARVDAPPTSPR